jgi:hypothetical protein
MRHLITLALLLFVLASTLRVVPPAPAAPAAPLAPSERVFELRTYHCHPGRLDALNARFRDHTCGLFKKHGMDLIGFWTPSDGQKGHGDTLVYLLAFPSRAAADASWAEFREDPEWKAAKDASEKDGPIVKEVESVFLGPTDYSAIK